MLEKKLAQKARDQFLVTEEAQIYWDFLYPALREARLVSVIDVPALVQWCESLGAGWRARKMLASFEGMSLGAGQQYLPSGDDENSSGKELQALVLREKWAYEATKDLTAGFGGTPAARTKIELAEAQMDMFDDTNVVVLPLQSLHGQGSTNLPANGNG